jgi:hypothetical protein
MPDSSRTKKHLHGENLSCSHLTLTHVPSEGQLLSALASTQAIKQNVPSEGQLWSALASTQVIKLIFRNGNAWPRVAAPCREVLVHDLVVMPQEPLQHGLQAGITTKAEAIEGVHDRHVRGAGLLRELPQQRMNRWQEGRKVREEVGD